MDVAYQKALQQLALRAVPKVCRISTHLFMFLKYCKLISGETGMKVNSKGWGRALRDTISNWYLSQDPERLVMQVTKYCSLEGYTHRDVFRLSHIHPEWTMPRDHQYWKYHKEYDAIFKYIAKDSMNMRKGEEMLAKSKVKQCKSDDKIVTVRSEQRTNEMEEETKIVGKRRLIKVDEAALVENEKMTSKEASIGETLEVLQFLKDFERLQELTLDDADEAVQLINKHDFVYEHIPNDLLSSKKIWEALLIRMPLTVMMKNLGAMTAGDLLGSKKQHRVYNQMVVDKLMDEKELKEAEIHPISILLTYATYSIGGHEWEGKMKWEPNEDIVNALEKAFYASFQYLTPTNKRYCLSFNVSGSMNSLVSKTMLSCSQAASAYAMTFVRTESSVTTTAFSDRLTPFKFDCKMNLDEVVELMKRIPVGVIDCALPMIWAKQERLPFDVFIIYTSDETCYDYEQPFVALQEYRTAMNIPDAKLIVMSMIETELNKTDSVDPNILNICGLESSVPDLIREFVSGTLSS
ncbi:hypothetical protein LOAG_07736 [Loa loa]|uniref:TROVE domain-containing protein n=1 Tax=Loa loa TaxID=7209 RepID=A0A1S0TVA0_LOALO|nr:hypothetical protein LOAG_07736 [Loa loa]EFO20755.2 hypothetical protein LOAG_07736 [Loa loa]